MLAKSQPVQYGTAMVTAPIYRALMVFVLVMISLPATRAESELESIRLKYEIERELLHKPIATLRTQYKARLLELKNQFSEAGNLNAALAAEAAITAAAKGDPDPDKIDSSVAGVARTQEIFLKQLKMEIIKTVKFKNSLQRIKIIFILKKSKKKP